MGQPDPFDRPDILGVMPFLCGALTGNILCVYITPHECMIGQDNPSPCNGPITYVGPSYTTPILGGVSVSRIFPEDEAPATCDTLPKNI